MSDTADRIAKILEDPESIKMISEIAESFMNGSGSIIQEKSETEKAVSDITTAESVSEMPSNAFSSITTIFEKLISQGDVENTVRLINALKPYMSSHRRESADSVLKMLNLMHTIGKSNIADMAKLFGMIGK